MREVVHQVGFWRANLNWAAAVMRERIAVEVPKY